VLPSLSLDAVQSKKVNRKWSKYFAAPAIRNFPGKVDRCAQLRPRFAPKQP
jgi:hypothetical protein